MAIFSGIASFRATIDPRSFVVHVGEEEYVTIDESVLCGRFRLLESTLLVKREEFDESRVVSNIVCVRPISMERGW